MSLSGNRIIGLQKETKVCEARVSLTPEHIRELLATKAVDKVIVQPSSIRCYNDMAYKAAGAEISDDLSEAGTIFAVKEVPIDRLLPDRSYVFFSHTIKAQPTGMPLLDEIIKRNIRLFDYERICDEDGRMVKYGPFAGYAGAVDTISGLAVRLLTGSGLATPFLNVRPSTQYRSLDAAREDIRMCGQAIRSRGLPLECCPLVFAVTGSGAVSAAVQQILHHLPCKYVEVEDLPNLKSAKKVDNKCVYVVVIAPRDMVEKKEPGKAFNQKEYFTSPHLYRPVFHENVAPYISVLITGHYWEPRYPRLLTIKQSQALQKENRFPLLFLADITCDIGGSIEFMVKSTTIQNPMYGYDIKNTKVIDFENFKGDGVLILAVDHLPAEFPCESSTSFGDNLKPLVSAVASSKVAGVSLGQQEKDLGKPLFGAMVTLNRALTPNYEYIAALRAKNEAAGKSKL